MKLISLLILFTLLLVPLSTHAQDDTKLCNDELSNHPVHHAIAMDILGSVDEDALKFDANAAVVRIVAYSMSIRPEDCGLQTQFLVIIFQFEVWRLQMNYAQGLIDEAYYNQKMKAWHMGGNLVVMGVK